MKTEMEFEDDNSSWASESDDEVDVLEFETFERHVLSKGLVPTELFIFYDKILRACKKASFAIESGCIFPFAPTEGCIPKMDTGRVICELREEILDAARTTPSIGYIFPSHSDTYIENGDGTGAYCFGFNAIVGPHNLLVNLPVGTIFGLWKNPRSYNKSKEFKIGDMDGHEMVGSGYILYGTITVLVLAFQHGTGVYQYHLDQGLGNFVLESKKRKVLARRGKLYSLNEGYTLGWCDATKKMAVRMKDPRFGRPRSAHTIGSLVPDFHRIFVHGGFYMYPANKLEPTGGLKLLQECWPIAYICNESGGFATEGNEGVLILSPSSPTQTIPLYAGSLSDCISILDFNFLSVANRLLPAKPEDRGRRQCPLCMVEVKSKPATGPIHCPTCKYVLKNK